jgi:subtilase family serine protease
VGIPASFPEVTAIGGTEFNEGGGRFWNTTQTINLSSAISYIPETVWNDTGLVTSLKIASGGGPSAIFAKPYWQSAAGVPDDGARDIPDVSMAASYLHDGYLIVYQGALYSFGGTSAGAPAFAGVVALVNQALASKGVITKAGLGNINPTL